LTIDQLVNTTTSSAVEPTCESHFPELLSHGGFPRETLPPATFNNPSDYLLLRSGHLMINELIGGFSTRLRADRSLPICRCFQKKCGIYAGHYVGRGNQFRSG
jgi:hypothetical protein